MPRVVLDENVSLRVADRLKALNFEILAIAQRPDRGMSDEEVFALVADGSTLLVTRDRHFTNPLRFPSGKTGGILFITSGNLRSQEEADLVEGFLKTHQAGDLKGKLVFLSMKSTKVR